MQPLSTLDHVSSVCERSEILVELTELVENHASFFYSSMLFDKIVLFSLISFIQQIQ